MRRVVRVVYPDVLLPFNDLIQPHHMRMPQLEQDVYFDANLLAHVHFDQFLSIEDLDSHLQSATDVCAQLDLCIRHAFEEDRDLDAAG